MSDPDKTEFPLEAGYMPTIKVTKRTDRSLYMFAVQHCIKPFRGHLIKPKKQFPPGSQKLEPHKKAKTKCDVQEREIDGFYVYDLVPHNTSGAPAGEEKVQKKRIYWFAGGGWQMPPSQEHWALCAELARKLPGAIITIISYPLAPQSAAPTAFPVLQGLYHTLLAQAQDAGERVILAGDSAGGNIILALTLACLAEDPDCRVPAALLAISPSTDLRRCNPEMALIAKHDPILTIPFVNNTAKSWRADLDPCDPRVSPLYADVRPLATRGVKVHGVTGKYDILGPDAVLFREKCSQASVTGEWLDWEKQMHCFPLMWSFGMPEGKQSLEWIRDVLERA